MIVGLLMNMVIIFIMRDYWKVQLREEKEFTVKKTAFWHRVSDDKTQQKLFLTFTDA